MSNRSASIFLLLAAWLVPPVWTAGVLAGNHIGTGMAGFVLHMFSWPFAWTASLMLGAAAAVKWYECEELRRVPRALGTVFGAVSALVAFPGGLYGTAVLLGWTRAAG